MKKLSAFSTSALEAIKESTALTRTFYIHHYIHNVLKVCREEDLAKASSGRPKNISKVS